MALNDKENFGRPISDEMVDYLTKNTSKKDEVKSAVETGFSPSLAEKLKKGWVNLTENNYPLYESLVKRAISNAQQTIEALQYMEKELNG